MKNFMKKIAVFALIAAMTVAAFCGCSKKTGAGSVDSMFGVLKACQNLDKWEGTMTLTLDTAQMNVSAELTAICDGDATAVSAKIGAGGFSFEIKNLFVVTNDAMYINVDAVYDALGNYLDAAGYSKEDLGITKDWISFTAEDAFKKDMAFSSSIFDAMDEVYKDLIDEDDGEYKMVISDKDDAQEFIDATVVLLEENKEEWAEYLSDAISKVDYSSIKNDIIEANEKAGNVLDEEDIDEMFSVDEDALDELPSKEEFVEMFDDAIESFKESELEDFDGKVSFTTSAKGKEYKYKAEIESEGDAVYFESVINKISDADVYVPSEDETESFADFIVKYYSHIEELNGYDDDYEYDEYYDDYFYYNDDYEYDDEEYYYDDEADYDVDFFNELFGEES